ncbi:MAG: TolC family protein [Thermoguttaceae bacterium]|nr:TolC family protein [Thermoguttaceae bacterium]
MKPYFQRGIALGALLALAVGGGCKVGSDYQKPDVAKQVSASYSETKEEAQVSLQTGDDVSSWWRQINDPVLAQLTQEAVSGNLTLQEALFRIQSARAALGSTNSNLLPQFAQDGGYAHQTYGGHSQSVFSTATSMSWELDVFGRIQRSIEAANADMEVQRWLYRDAYVILVADVAQAYVDARSYQDQIRSAKISILVQQCIVDYVKNNVDAGRMAPLDISRAVAPMRTTEATLSTLETQYQQAVNRLSILLGRPTGDAYVASTLLDDRALPTMEELNALVNSGQEADREKFVAIMRNLFLEDLRIPKTPETLLVGIPADLLRRRPDVRAAEQRIIAQNARVGVAVADLYPMFTLSGSFGLEANSFSNMFDSDAITAGVGPGFRWNILNFGKYRFNIEAQRFMQEELIATYRQTVLEAAEDVDNALVTYANESGRNVKLEQAVEAYLDVLDKTLVIKSAGAGDIQPILEAAAGLVSNGLQFVQSKGNQTSSIVRLYRALGGDWDGAPAEPVETVATVASNYDPKEDWERRQTESEARIADALAVAQTNDAAAVVENADFKIAADDDLEATPELAEPIYALGDDAYADEALIAE